jgi:predicted AAA+ superfamily ATPase
LLGENPSEGGHYITVWAPRQAGKTWVMQQILFKLKKDTQFDVLKINLQSLKDEKVPVWMKSTNQRNKNPISFMACH